MTYEEYKQKYKTPSNVQPTNKVTTYQDYVNKYKTPQNISKNTETQANAYNTLLNATNVSTYDEMQAKAPKFDLQINTGAGDTGSLNTPKYQEIKSKKDGNIVTESAKTFGKGTLVGVTNIYDYAKAQSDLGARVTNTTKGLLSIKDLYNYDPNAQNLSYKERLKRGQIASANALGQLEMLANKSESLKELYNQIKNGTFKGTEEDLERAIYADELEQIEKDRAKTQWARDMYADQIEKNAELGPVAGKIANAFGTVGNMIPTAGATMINPLLGQATLFANSAGGAYNEAIENGALPNEASLNATLTGGLELATEAIGGEKISKLTGVPTLTKKLGFTPKGTVGKLLLEIGSEEVEELVNTFVQPLINKMTYDKNAPMATKEDYWNTFVDTALSTVLLMGLSDGISAVNNYKNTTIEKIEESNMTTEQKEQAKAEVQKGANEIIEQVKKQNIAQTSPNNENISQNNVQNVSNLENTVQKDVNNNTLFKQGLEKFKKREYADEDDLVLLERAPEYFYNLGYDSEENVVINMKKLEETMREPKGTFGDVNQHGITYDVVEQLPEAISNPLNIIKNPKFRDRFVLITSLTDQYGDIVIVPIEMNTKGRVIRVNTVYGKEYYDLKKAENIQSYMERNKDNIVYDIDNDIKKRSLMTNVHPGLQLPNMTDSSASINNIIPNSQNYVNNQNILPSNEQLQAQDKKQSEEIYNTLNMKTRKFTESARNVEGVPSEYKKAVKNNPNSQYEPISNAETLEKAKQIIKSNRNIEKEFLENDLLFAEDTAVGELLIKKALEENDIKKANELTASLAEKLTRAGQVVQAAALIKRMTPEGMLVYGQKQLKKAVDSIAKENSSYYDKLKKEGIISEDGKIELTEEESKQIVENMNKVQELEDGREKDVLIGKTMSIIANKIPATALEKVASLRRSGLLLNLKTLSRNVGSNATMSAMETFKDIPATALDSLVSLVTGQRTTKLPSLKAYGKGFGKGFKNAVEDVYLGIDTSSNKNGKYSISKKGKAFKRKNTYKQIMQMYKQGQTKEALKATFSRLLSDYEDTSTFIVDGTDKPFWQARFETELKRQMELNNLVYGEDIPTTEMLEIATEQADYATFKNKTAISGLFGGAKNVLNFGKPIGLADALGLTFTNVPGNVASKVIDYSPVEAIKQIYNLATKKGKFDQRKFVDGLARSITGSGTIALGAWLISKGILRGANDDDKDIANMEQAMGLQENSLNLSAIERLIKGEDTTLREGDKFYTFDWNQPFSANWIVGADIYKALQNDEDAVWAGVKSAINQIADMSSISTVSKLFRGYSGEDVAENVGGVLLDFPASFIPTIFNNIGQFTDKYYRQTKDATSNIRTSINKMLNKIPGARETLEKRVDTFGNDVVQYKDGNDFTSTFVDPGYKSTYNPTEVQKELLSVYKATGDKSIFPMQVNNSFTYQDESKKLTAKEISTYQKATGEYASEMFDLIVNASYYDSLDMEQRAKLFTKVVEDSNLIGKASLGVETKDYLKYEEKVNDLEESGIPLLDYYNAWIATQGIESDKNWKGETITNSKSKKQKEAIDKATPDLDKWERRKLYEIFNVGKSVW